MLNFLKGLFFKECKCTDVSESLRSMVNKIDKLIETNAPETLLEGAEKENSRKYLLRKKLADILISSSGNIYGTEISVFDKDKERIYVGTLDNFEEIIYQDIYEQEAILTKVFIVKENEGVLEIMPQSNIYIAILGRNHIPAQIYEIYFDRSCKIKDITKRYQEKTEEGDEFVR